MKEKNLWKVQSANQTDIEIFNEQTQEYRKITWEEIRPKRKAKNHQISTNTLLKEKEGLYYIKSKKFLFILFILMLCGTLFGCFLMHSQEKPEDKIFNRYLEEISEDVETNTNSSQTRFKFNSSIIVKRNTIQNLNMENVNQGKSMEMLIKIDDDVVFDSHLIGYKQKLVGDVLKKELKKGTYDGLAEVYTYKDIDGQPVKVNQTNFKIKLTVVE